MSVDAVLDRAVALGLDIRLAQDGEHIDVPGTLPRDIEEAILANRSEVLFHLADQERSEVLTRLEALRKKINEGDEPAEDRPGLRDVAFDPLLDRLWVLERVIAGYEQSGLASWYREGWVMIHSSLLSETVVVVRDEVALRNLPGGARVFPMYRFEEMEALKDCDEPAIRRAHAYKRAFHGSVRAG
ncbi:MAG: hypothetical protein ABSG85_13090 [Spirochaetia bacterium]|jgi:hypothetical protein